MPAISVVMPCFNVADTLEAALESLAMQSCQNYEVIAVDDGSTDSTPRILQTWQKKDERLQIIRLQHQGIIAALNAGLEACRADYIARMDGDDRSHPARLELQMAYLEAGPDLAVAGCLVEGFPNENVRQGFQIYLEWLNSLVSDSDIRREIFIESPLVHPSVMFRRAWVEKVGGYQERGWAEDYDLWLRLYLAGGKFGKVPQVLFSWREHPDRLTRTDNRYSLENFLRAKAHYLVCGPLAGRDGVILWGAGMVGRRLSKHLGRSGAPLVAFVDIDSRKIGRTRRGLPIVSPEDLPAWLRRYANPVVLAAVGARGARAIIRQRLNSFGLREGLDWWCVA